MKKTQKRVLGLCGLTVVVATTVFAATLPSPSVSAVGGTQATDHLQVRVVGDKANIDIISPTSGSTVLSPVQDMRFEYEGVDKITVNIRYTDPDGVTHDYVYDEIYVNYAPSEYNGTIDLSGANYGYGEYTVTVVGEGADGIPGTDSISFSYYPADVTIEETPGTDGGGGDSGDDGSGDDGSDGSSGGQTGGDYTLHFGYDTESDLGRAIGADVMINDKPSGKLMKEFAVAPFPTDTYRVVFADYGLPSGTYLITVRVAYEYNNGKIYYVFYTFEVTYGARSTKVPDTGGAFGNLNISQSDYLATGLIAFGVVGVTGFFYVARKGKKTTRRR